MQHTITFSPTKSVEAILAFRDEHFFLSNMAEVEVTLPASTVHSRWLGTPKSSPCLP